MFSSEREHYFDTFLANSHLLKYAFVAVAVMVILLFVPLYYSVVWYERYGHDQKRTLLNQLTAFICKVVIAYLLVCVSGDIFISLSGPLPFCYCHLQLYLKQLVVAILILSVNCIMIVRHVLIFWLKTPSIVHDDFEKTDVKKVTGHH